MKKKNWLMTIAFAVLALTIVSTCVIGSTYAKFTQQLNSSASVKAAGFLVTAGTQSNIAATEVIEPGETLEVVVPITYFSQVNTNITAEGTLTGAGVLNSTAWTALISAYNTAYELTGGNAVAYTINDIFAVKVSYNTGTDTWATASADLAGTFCDAVVAHAGSSAVTKAGAQATGWYLTPMAAAETDAITFNLKVTVTWKSDYAAEAEVNRFDTFVGNYIYNMLHASTGDDAVLGVTTPTATTISLSLPITAEQRTAA